MFFKKSSGTMEYDFGFAIVILCTGVLKKGNSIHDEDVEVINSFFEKHFTVEFNSLLPRMLKLSMSRSYPLLYVAFIIRKFTNYQTRVNIVRLLLQLCAMDPDDGELKRELCGTISAHLGVQSKDWALMNRMTKRSHSLAYDTLEIPADSTYDEIKKAYRKLALKHHPDKFHHLGKEKQEEAHDAFKRIKKAYEEIKRIRGI
jgi:DnaJ-domain-containing protein 1